MKQKIIEVSSSVGSPILSIPGKSLLVAINQAISNENANGWKVEEIFGIQGGIGAATGAEKAYLKCTQGDFDALINAKMEKLNADAFSKVFELLKNTEGALKDYVLEEAKKQVENIVRERFEELKNDFKKQ